MKPLRPIVPGGNLWAEDENAKAVELSRLSKMSVEGGEIVQTAAGPQLTIPGRPLEFWARIDLANTYTGGCSTAYGWVQQRPLPGGCFEDILESEGGMRGDAAIEPAYEINQQPLEREIIVWLRRGASELLGNVVKSEWLFDGTAGIPCCNSGGGDPCQTLITWFLVQDPYIGTQQQCFTWSYDLSSNTWLQAGGWPGDTGFLSFGNCADAIGNRVIKYNATPFGQVFTMHDAAIADNNQFIFAWVSQPPQTSLPLSYFTGGLPRPAGCIGACDPHPVGDWQGQKNCTDNQGATLTAFSYIWVGDPCTRTDNTLLCLEAVGARESGGCCE